jgi:hypothetical protein
MLYMIDFEYISAEKKAYSGVYVDSSADKGLTCRRQACFSSSMTQRSIQHPNRFTAQRAARLAVIAQTERIDMVVVNVALTALVLVVVVLITTFTGAG